MSSTSLVKHQKASASTAKNSSMLRERTSSRESSRYFELWLRIFYGVWIGSSLPSSRSYICTSSASLCCFFSTAPVKKTSSIGAAKSFMPCTYALAGCRIVHANRILISIVCIYWLEKSSTSGWVRYTSIFICLKLVVSYEDMSWILAAKSATVASILTSSK